MITEKTVAELAVTCRLRLSEEEQARFAKDLSELMELASPLLSVEGTSPVSARRAADLCELREDILFARADGQASEMLSSVRQMQDGCPVVPRAVED